MNNEKNIANFHENQMEHMMRLIALGEADETRKERARKRKLPITCECLPKPFRT